MPNITAILLRRSYMVVTGLLLSVVAAAFVYSLIPPRYASSGIAVLVQPKQPGAISVNPLLKFDNSLNTTAQILVQALNSPAVRTDVGLTAERDSFTVKNTGGANVGDSTGQPFIYVTSLSTVPNRSADIVSGLFDRARRELATQQDALRVPQHNKIQLTTVVDATPPKLAPEVPIAVSGVALTIGIALTITAACVLERLVVVREARRGDWAAAFERTSRPRNPAVSESISRLTTDHHGCVVDSTVRMANARRKG